MRLGWSRERPRFGVWGKVGDPACICSALHHSRDGREWFHLIELLFSIMANPIIMTMLIPSSGGRIPNEEMIFNPRLQLSPLSYPWQTDGSD